jgi:tetratricopeptide (TPR) repeat protein
VVQDERLGRGFRPRVRGAPCPIPQGVASSVPADQGSLSLVRSGNSAAADGMFQRVIAEYPESLDAPSAWEHLGDLRRAAGERGTAADCYREALRLGALRHVWGSAGLSLGEVLIENGDERSSEEALQVLRGELPRIVFNASRFRWELALATVSERLGDLETSRRAARRALALLEASPQFPRHGDVGIATGTPEQLELLARLAGT